MGNFLREPLKNLKIVENSKKLEVCKKVSKVSVDHILLYGLVGSLNHQILARCTRVKMNFFLFIILYYCFRRFVIGGIKFLFLIWFTSFCALSFEHHQNMQLWQ